MKFQRSVLRKRSIVILLLFSINSTILYPQIKVSDGNTPPFTPEKMIENIFLGDGVEVINVDFCGSRQAVGVFTNGTDHIGLDRGIVMSTGLVSSAEQSNSIMSYAGDETSGGLCFDQDLAATTTVDLEDVVKYEITFIPSSDTLRFRYVFASEEYPEFACSSFNDVFGFFISGPDPAGGSYVNKNIALVPDTLDPSGETFFDFPVTINYVNNGFGSLGEDISYCESPIGSTSFSTYYNEVVDGSFPVYDGYLDIFIAQAIVVPCQEYAIKLAIGDGFDDDYDSAVFLEARSFATGSLQVDLNSPSLDGGLAEGCTNGTLIFSLPEIQSQPYPITFNILDDPNLGPLAEEGIDYTPLQNIISIPQGASSVYVDLNIIRDNIQEGTEYIVLEIPRDACSTDTLRIPIKDNNLDLINLPADMTTCSETEVDISPVNASSTQIFDTLTFSSDMSFDIAADTTLYVSPINVNGVFPLELSLNMISKICFDTIIHTYLNDLDIYLETPGRQLLELSTDNGTRPDNATQVDTFIETCFTPTAMTNINRGDALQGQMDLANPTYTGSYLPEGNWEDLTRGKSTPSNGTYALLIYDDEPGFNGYFGSWSISFNPFYSIDYLWSPVDGSLSCYSCPEVIASPAQSTTYTLTLNDSYGCSKTDSIDVNIASTPLIPQDLTCASANPSSIMITWSPDPGAEDFEIRFGAQGPWASTGGSTFLSLENLLPEESFIIYVRGLNSNCYGPEDSILCQSPPCMGTLPLVTDIEIYPISCNSSADGGFQIAVSDPNPPLRFVLNNMENTDGLFQGLDDGVYDVRIFNNEGCGIIQQVVLTDPSPLLIDVQVDGIDCFGDNNGAIAVQAIGGTPPYTYEWNIGTSDTLLTDLEAGLYIITVRDSAFCTNQFAIPLENPQPLQSSLTQIDTSMCSGDDNAVAEATIFGGTFPYTITSSAVVQNDSIFGLSDGYHHVTITDANNCMREDSIFIYEPPLLSVQNFGDSVPCPFDSSGTISVNPIGGLGPFTYSWSTGDTTQEVSNLPVGQYEVTITDALGCVLMESTTVDAPPQIEVEEILSPVTCFGGGDGSIAIEISGGTGTDYTVIWDNGSNNTMLTDLTSETYCVTITDEIGCDIVQCYELGSADVISANATITNVSCSDQPIGAIEIDPQGGNNDFSYTWSGPGGFMASFEDIAMLVPGSYSLTITDNLSEDCFSTFTFEVTDESDFALNFAIDQDITCHMGSDGAVAGVVTGGIQPYSYMWDAQVSNPLDSIAAGLTDGQYTLVVTDAAGCTLMDSIEIRSPDPIVATYSVDHLACSGDQTGEIFISSVSGGQGDYTVLWFDQSTKDTIRDLGAGSYGVTVTDSVGCELHDNITIEEPDLLELEANVYDARCHGADNGRIEGTPSGGTPPYQYSIDGNNYNPGNLINGLAPGLYSLFVRDNNACETFLDNLIIDEPPQIIVDLGNDTLVSFGANVSLEASIFPGPNDIYTYIWEAPEVNKFSCTDCPEPTVSFVTTSFPVTLTVVDTAGCSGMDFKDIFVVDTGTIEVPTGFSPNNDGVNDRLHVFGNPTVTVLEFRIFSRWGELVYFAENIIPNDTSVGWDGQFKGKEVDQNTFVWTALIRLQSGREEFLKGTTTLIR